MGGVRPVCPLCPGLLAGAGPPRRQAGPVPVHCLTKIVDVKQYPLKTGWGVDGGYQQSQSYA